MDDLHRLYEHQTLMALGIYSFLDNLLSHIPSQTDSDEPNQAAIPRLRTGLSDLPDSLLDLGRTDSFRQRHERVRLLPRLPSWLSGERLSQRERSESGSDVRSDQVRPNTDGVNCPEVIPGGYPEEIFIYLSEKEKGEFICSVCYLILKEAHQCQNEHKFCYGCIYTWSIGPSTGHDGCPVCRCDGLYAKNYELISRINRKRTRCTTLGCNWMGLLTGYMSHEHRRYTPYELDILLTGENKEHASKSTTNAEKENSFGSGSQQQQQLATNSDCNSGIYQSFGSVSSHQLVELNPIHRPLSSASSISNSRFDVGEQNLQRSTRSTLSRARLLTSEQSIGRRISASSPNHIRNEVAPTPPRHRLSSRNSINTPTRTSLLYASRTRTRSRLLRAGNASRSSHRSSDRSNRNRNRQSNRSPTRNRSQQAENSFISDDIQSSERDVQIANEASPQNNRAVHIPHRSLYSAEPRLLQFRPTAGSLTSELNNTRDVEPISTPLSSATDRQGTNVYLTRTNQSSDNRNVDIHNIDSLFDHDSCDQQTDRNANFALPSINSSTCLTGHVTRQAVDVPPLNVNSFSGLQAYTHSTNTSEGQQLEFRRLAPRRQGRVVDQLRETREQLSAMLRLMTLELDQRRNHILTAALETSARTERLRNLNAMMTAAQITGRISNSQLDTNDAETTHNNFPLPEEQSHAERGRPFILENLPVPTRNRQALSSNPLQLLTNRLLQETNSQHVVEMGQRFPTTMQSRCRDLAAETSTDTSDGEQEEDFNATVSRQRLLTRLRLDAIIPTEPTPPVVVGPAHLGQLLNNMRFPRTTFNEWSSEEDDDDD